MLQFSPIWGCFDFKNWCLMISFQGLRVCPLTSGFPVPLRTAKGTKFYVTHLSVDKVQSILKLIDPINCLELPSNTLETFCVAWWSLKAWMLVLKVWRWIDDVKVNVWEKSECLENGMIVWRKDWHECRCLGDGLVNEKLMLHSWIGDVKPLADGLIMWM